MVFSGKIFLFGFLPLVLAGYFALPRSLAAKNVFLCAASLLFYAWGEPFVVLVMMASIAANWAMALVMRRRRRAAVLCAAVAFNVAVLVVFKYLGFVVANINALAGGDILPVPHIRLPIGISFFTFQALSYVVDVYRGVVPAQRSLLKVGLYISLFPQLVAGPIVRYATIARQIDERGTALCDLVQGTRRFVVGLAKKVLLADRLAELADICFDAPAGVFASLPAADLWLGALAYSFQILFDFSGYSDMAIGLGRIFGFRFEENFNRPYSATSITDFWRRWHMSLSGWFRDYVYIPLGGNRVSKPRLLLNLFVVWALTGLWHGANWTFVAWGLGYFALLAAEKFTDRSGWPKFVLALSRPYTVLCVVLLWVVFRAKSLSSACDYLRGMFALGGNGLAGGTTAAFTREFGIWFALSAFVCFCWRPIHDRLARKDGAGWAVAKECCWILLLAATLASVANSSYSPFIYFNF